MSVSLHPIFANELLTDLRRLRMKHPDVSLKKNIMADIEERVKAIIVDKLGVDESEVTNEASFANDLGADSLDTVELITSFEKEFGIKIPDEQAENVKTVQEAIDCIINNQQ